MKIKSFNEFSTPAPSVKEDETITKKIVYRNEDEKDDEAVPFENEEVDEEDGAEEIQMAMGELERIGDYAGMISNKIKTMPDLEAWVQSKITKAKDYMMTVHDYLDGVDGVKESVNEAKFKVLASFGGYDLIEAPTEKDMIISKNGKKVGKLTKVSKYLKDDIKLFINMVKSDKVGESVNEKVIQGKGVEDLNESTRWQVGTIDKKGNIESAYVHYDGSPDTVKPLLTKHYNDKKKIDSMMKLAKVAGVSYLAPEVGTAKQNFNDPDYNVSLFYGRDRGEKGKPWATGRGNASDVESYIKDMSNNSSADYVYLYDERDGKWYYASYKDRGLKQL